MKDIEEKLDKILFWLEFIGKREAREFMLSILNDSKDIALYQFSDGKNGYSELKKITKITDTTIKEKWEKWQEMGILDMKSVKGGERGVRKYNLLELGIDIPIIE